MPDSPVPPKPGREPRGPDSPENSNAQQRAHRPVIRPAVSEGWRHTGATPGTDSPSPRQPEHSYAAPSHASDAGPQPDATRAQAREGETYYDYIDRHSGPIPVQSTPPPAYPGSGTSQPDGGRGKPRRTVMWFTVGAVLLAVALVVGFIVFSSPTNDVEIADPTPSTSQGQGSPTASESGDPEAALTALAEEGGRAATEELDGQWVVQLSAKQDGLEANGRTWDDAAILEEFEANRARYPEAILLWSTDWSTFQLPDFWITVLSTPYDNPDDALAWCTDAGLDRDNCFAKKISSTESYEDSTRLNP